MKASDTMDRKSEIRSYMIRQINSLTSAKDTSGGRARLAELRRGAGKAPGELPELWGAFLNGMPEELLSRNGEPSRSEWAVYLALTMYALHQQGNSTVMHKADVSLGAAAEKLMSEPTDDERQRVLRRFGPVVTAKTMPELAHHLRSIVQLLSSKGIGQDYVRLAVDIYDFQSDECRKRVQLRWGQDFYYKKGEDE